MGEMMNGKKIAKETREKLKIKCDELKEKGINPKFAAIMVGNDNASQIYIRNKSKACEEIGIEFEEYLLSENIEQKELIEKIKELNNRKDIHGILLQSPIPANLDINEAFRTIAPEKDVDGFNPLNIGKLCLNQDTFVSCTPYGINTHRLLVRGHRVETKASASAIRVTADAIQIEPKLVAPAVAVPILVVLLIWVLLHSRKRKR